MTLFVVSYNLKKYIDIETVRSLSDLRSKLNAPDKRLLHAYLLQQKDVRYKSDKVLSEFDGIFKVFVERYNPTLSQNSKLGKYCKKLVGDSDVLVYDYLGTIELGAIMLERGAITVDDFWNQFGYRLIAIINNRELMYHINECSESYKPLIWVIELMKRKKKCI